MSEHVFTDDEIRQIIDVINRTKHTQYIGARYVPIFGRVNEDNIDWDNSEPYEPLTIVLHQGNSYTSRQYVPAGVEITNEQYWANTGNYNAQVERYRQEVRSFDGRITANETAITGVNGVLGALGASDVELASALAKTIDDTKKLSDANANGIARNDTAIANKADKTSVYTKTESDGKYLTKTAADETTELVVIGDSYAQGIGASDTAHQFANIVADSLGLNPHNYAIGGTGFNNQGGGGNGRFDNQMATAVNDKSYPHDKVKYVIVEGGTNDWGDTTTARTVTQTICEQAAENFPNARILFVLTQGVGPGSVGLYPANKVINYPAIQEAASQYDNADVLRGDFWFNIWNAADFSSGDMIHPNNNGHQFIASRIICALRYGDFSKIENLRSSHSQGFVTINEEHKENISDFSTIMYFIGNGLGDLTIRFRYTVQADEINASGTYYQIDKALLDFPDNVQIKYPNISPLEYSVSKAGTTYAFSSKHGIANLFNFSSPLKFCPGTIAGLPAGTANAGDKLIFSVKCVFPYFGYSH